MVSLNLINRLSILSFKNKNTDQYLNKQIISKFNKIKQIQLEICFKLRDMESIVTGIVSLIFKILDKYVVYNMATSSIIPKLSLFCIFALIEFIIVFSVLENILEDVIKACFKFYRNQTPLSSHLDIQSFITLLITVHSVINKALIYSGYGFFDSFLISLAVLFGVIIFILEQYNFIYRFVSYDEKKAIISKKQKIEDSYGQNNQDSFVVISFEEEKSISNRIQTQKDKKANQKTADKQIYSNQTVQITHLYWVLNIIYLIFIKWMLKKYIDSSTSDFQKFKFMLVDFFFLYPILSGSHKIQSIQLQGVLILNILSQCFLVNIQEVHILITYIALVFIVKKYGKSILNLVISILVLVYLNDFILQFIIHQTRMHFSIKIIFNIIGLSMLCFFYRVSHEGLIYASFLPAIQFILFMIWFFVFVFHIEKQVYSTQSYLTDLIKEQAGLIVLLNFEIAILNKISNKISNYLYQIQNTMQHQYQQNIIFEILNDNVFQIIWYQDPLMKMSLKKMNTLQFYVCFAFMHLFFGSSNMFSFIAFQVIMNPYFWISSFQNKRYFTFIIVTFSYVSKYMLNKGFHFILKYLINCTLVIFSWKKSLLANLIPVIFENYTQIMSQENSRFQIVNAKSNDYTSNWEIFIVSVSFLSAIGFLVSNSLINNITKRIRDLLVPFMIYFLIFQDSSSQSKYICLNFMLSFVQDLGILTKDM
ncbi:transmembrane protein, putative (macronuclear) [Tetrahymena thermophila SB210]|uniref:Transmembrane protein, putative n=1 Tax=Tetrahymena thermophila (strain SB210) TaxID=312017 RepID=W7XET7_TETTS|nr:transmembrane protein, putative [Tetrahymena thermophila SB210]EWS72451.1 transmembrane protein, putative [Tetrahymena thermophila SB210]|eukprot:XP_012654996.1 transmembrane protein, putative [Tetrahymena thermophila SB210]